MNQPPNQPPNLFNGNSSSPHPLAGLNIPNPEVEDLNLQTNRPKVHDPRTIKVLKQLYISLIVIGIVLGGVVSIGVLSVMKHFGLTSVPTQVQNNPK